MYSASSRGVKTVDHSILGGGIFRGFVSAYCREVVVACNCCFSMKFINITELLWAYGFDRTAISFQQFLDTGLFQVD